MTQKEIFQDMFRNGYYILHTKNVTKFNDNKIVHLYSIVKDENETTKSINCYIASDVIKTLVKDCGAKIVNADRTSIWLNKNPQAYKPSKGCKMTFHNALTGKQNEEL